MRICGCSSPNGGPLVKVPKKSLSSVAFGAHLPSTGEPLNVKLMRVFRTSASLKSLTVVGWVAGGAAHSAFCPCPNEPNSPRSVNSVALMKPLMVSVSPSPSLTTCCAGAARAPARMTTAATAGPENDAIRLVMTFPSMKGVEGGALTPRLLSVGRGIRRLRQVHGRGVDDAVRVLGHLELLHHRRRRDGCPRGARAGGTTAAAGRHDEKRGTENRGSWDGRTDLHGSPLRSSSMSVCSLARPSALSPHGLRRRTARRGRATRETI